MVDFATASRQWSCLTRPREMAAEAAMRSCRSNVYRSEGSHRGSDVRRRIGWWMASGNQSRIVPKLDKTVALVLEREFQPSC